VYAPIPYSPKDYQRDRGETGLQPPLASLAGDHWFGTEENGADVLSRMIHASRIALGIGFIATGIAMILGIFIGGIMGYFSGIADIIGMRLVEIFEAVPTLFLLLTFVAFFERSLYMLMVIIGITSWSGYARYVRAEFLRLRQQDFVQAALACGLPLRSILFRHMLPNGIGPILVAASFGVASAILAEAVLSFLGLGLIDDPSWGQMLNQAVKSSTFNWWMAAFPGGAIFFTVFAYNLVGEALRDAIDPYLKKS
jgi:peptide/nickel transport system permease protein